jgi:CheY-like chemotaxis protein
MTISFALTLRDSEANTPVLPDATGRGQRRLKRAYGAPPAQVVAARRQSIHTVRRLLFQRVEALMIEPFEPVSAQASRHGVPRVLIVDDELEHAEICAALLRRRGYKVAVALSGLDAIELARALHPDLILLDVFMPGVDGFSTAAALHEHSDTQDVPIVFLSACGEAIALRRALELGVSGYLDKPFHAAELIDCVERSLARPMRQKTG